MDGGPYQFDIYTIAPDGSDLRRLTSHPAYECDPAWSPDSSRLAFTSAREGSFDVFTINADGTDERRLTFNSSADGSAWWSPDGRRIVFASNRAKHKRHELYVMSADGGDAVRLTRRTGTWPRWNPRDNRIVFTSTGQGNDEEVLLVEVPPAPSASRLLGESPRMPAARLSATSHEGLLTASVERCRVAGIHGVEVVQVVRR